MPLLFRRGTAHSTSTSPRARPASDAPPRVERVSTHTRGVEAGPRGRLGTRRDTKQGRGERRTSVGAPWRRGFSPSQPPPALTADAAARAALQRHGAPTPRAGTRSGGGGTARRVAWRRRCALSPLPSTRRGRLLRAVQPSAHDRVARRRLQRERGDVRGGDKHACSSVVARNLKQPSLGRLHDDAGGHAGLAAGGLADCHPGERACA